MLKKKNSHIVVVQNMLASQKTVPKKTLKAHRNNQVGIMFHTSYSMQEANRYQCSGISIRKSMHVKHTGLSLQRKRWIMCFPPRRLRVDMINSLVTSVVSAWSGHTGSPRLNFIAVYRCCYPPTNLITYFDYLESTFPVNLQNTSLQKLLLILYRISNVIIS